MRRLARPLLYVGTLAIVVGLGRYHAQFIGHYYFHGAQRLPWNLAYAAVLCLAAYGMGLPDLERDRSPWAASAGAAVVAAAAVSLVQLVAGSQILPRFVVFSAALLAIPWFALCVGVADIGRSRGEARDRVVLVSGPEERAALEAELGRDVERPAALVAALDPGEAHSSDPRSKPLIEAVVAERGTVVVLDRLAVLDETVVSQAATLHEGGVRVRTLPLFYDQWLGKLPLSELERMSLMFDVGDLHRIRYGRARRILDLIVGLIGTLVLALITPAVLVGNLIANRGPLLYRQQRVGRAATIFEILKFRTMRPGSPVG
jgi:hypothetical protein